MLKVAISLIILSFMYSQRFSLDFFGSYNLLLSDSKLKDHDQELTDYDGKSFSDFFKNDYGLSVGLKYFVPLTTDTVLRKDIHIGIYYSSNRYSFMKVSSSLKFGEQLHSKSFFPHIGYGQQINRHYIYALFGINFRSFEGVNLNEDIRNRSPYYNPTHEPRSDVLIRYADSNEFKVLLGADYVIKRLPVLLGYGLEFDFGETQLTGTYIKQNRVKETYENPIKLKANKMTFFIKCSYIIDFRGRI